MGVMIADEWVWAKGADDLKWIPFNSSDSIAITRLKSKDNENVLLMEKILKEIIAENSGKLAIHTLKLLQILIHNHMVMYILTQY
jgi:hypothetical protein